MWTETEGISIYDKGKNKKKLLNNVELNMLILPRNPTEYSTRDKYQRIQFSLSFQFFSSSFSLAGNPLLRA